MQGSITYLGVQDEVADFMRRRESLYLEGIPRRNKDGRSVTPPKSSRLATARIVSVKSVASFEIQTTVVCDISRVEQRGNTRHTQFVADIALTPYFVLEPPSLPFNCFLVHIVYFAKVDAVIIDTLRVVCQHCLTHYW